METTKNKRKQVFCTIISVFFMVCICVMPTYAWGRKLISKPISGRLEVDKNTMYYSFNSVAGITYNDSNNITQISDLSFNNVRSSMSNVNLVGSISPRMISKSYSGRTATYVVQVTRNFNGYYVDRINYTLRFYSTDAGTPYSYSDGDRYVLVDVEEGQPYDIVCLE